MFNTLVKLLVAIALAATFCFSQDETGKQTTRAKIVIPPEKASPVNIPRFDEPPVIDGVLDESVWKTAAKFENFIQTEPGDLLPPSRETIAYMGYDSKHLYIAFFCFDEPDKIRATVAKRDAVGGEDYVGVFLDTFDDQRRAYILQFNPLGIQADGIKTAGSQGSDFSVDIVMESKGAIHPNGWSVEVKIPFKSLRYKSGKDKTWGVDFWRRIDRFNREIDGWMPMERGVSELSQLGKITGFDDISTGQTIEVTPSVTFSESGERIGDPNLPGKMSRILNSPVKTEVGVSLKYQITPNITLDAAINPDFAEVESDAPVVRANQRFPIFFAEKRPFFLEGIDYFSSPLQLVNTRTIADPDVAVKLTGKIGKNTFGLLSAVDRFPNTDTKAYVGVLRLRRDVGARSNIGMFATQYHFGAKRHNSVLGVDGKYQIDDRTVFDFQVVGTHTRQFFYDPDTNSRNYRTGNGAAYRFTYDYTGRNRGLFASLNGRTAKYRALVGFTRRTDTHSAEFGWRLQTEPKPDNQLIGIVTRGFGGISMDGRGRLQNGNSNVRAILNFQDQLTIDGEFGVGFERLYEDEFGPRRNASQAGAFFGEPQRGTFRYYGEIGVNKSFGKRFSFDTEVGFTQNDFDLDFGASEKYPRVSPAYLQYLIDVRTNPTLAPPPPDPGKGFRLRYELGLNFQPTDPWNLRFSYDRTKLTRHDTDLTAFDANILTIRSTYQFTRFIFVRTRWDYETIDNTLNGQALIGWNPSPGTAFYIGYNDNLLYRGFNQFTGRFDDGLRRDSRSFFIRASYLFRKSF